MRRSSDPAIWSKAWFRQLKPAEKCFWKYLTDQCDAVGVWQPDFEAARFHIGEDIDWEAFPSKVNGNIEVLDDGRWWLGDFCDFQYGPLSPACRPHLSYIRLLERHGLLERVVRVEAPQKKAKPEEVRHKRGENGRVLLSDREYEALCSRYTQEVVDCYIAKMDSYCTIHGKAYRNYRQAVDEWVRRDVESGKLKLGVVKKAGVKKCPDCGEVYVGSWCKCGYSEGAA